MDQIVEATDPTLDQAFELLKEKEAEVAPVEEGSGTTEQAATPEPKTEVQPPKADSGTPGAPAATDSQKTTEPSKYEKNVQRQKSAWEQINQEKADVRGERERLKAEAEKLSTERKAFEDERSRYNQPKYTPDEYDKAADKFEAEGKFDLADKAREYAKYLRANPPKPLQTDAQKQAEEKAKQDKVAAEQKEWLGKAGIDFPKTVQNGTPEKAAFEALIKAEPGISNDPKGLYYGARLVTAETAAARVPTLEKELGDLRAKVKELEENLAIPTDGSVSGAAKGEIPFEQKSEDEQRAELGRQAEQIGYI